MGAIVPTVAQGLTVLGTAASAINSVSRLANSVENVSGYTQDRQNDLALRQLRQKQKLQAQQLAAQTALEREKIAAEAKNAEERRLAALRRAVARQRASFGGSGIGNSSEGSSNAVLLGLFDESEEELAARERLDNIRNAALDLGADTLNSNNVLARTQLAERNDIDRLQEIF